MAEIDMQPVSSSSVIAAGYDPDTQTMRVEFKGGIYELTDVPQAEFDTMMRSASVGSYYANFIKGRYPTEKL